MKKYNATISLLICFIFIFGVVPILNGWGCNAIFGIDDTSSSISGRCEKGGVVATVLNKETHDTYTMKGRLAIIGTQFFIFVEKINFINKSNHISDELNRYKYHRNVISGRLINSKYIIMYTPEPSILEVRITGRISFVPM